MGSPFCFVVQFAFFPGELLLLLRDPMISVLRLTSIYAPARWKARPPLRSDCSFLSLVDDFPGVPMSCVLGWTQFMFSEPDFTNLSFLAHLNNNYKYIKVVLLLNNVTCSYKCGMVRFFWYCKHLRQQIKHILMQWLPSQPLIPSSNIMDLTNIFIIPFFFQIPFSGYSYIYFDTFPGLKPPEKRNTISHQLG